MDFRQRLEQNRSRPVSAEPAPEPEDQYSCPYFATDKHPACLDLRLPDGVRRALPYSYFMEMRYDCDSGIEIYTSTRKITITGRNMTRLFDYLLSYRVRFIQANVGNDGNESGLFVKHIAIEEIN